MCTGISGVALGEAGDRTREKGSGGRDAVLCMEYLRHLRVHWVHLQWDMVSWIASVWTCSVRCARRGRRWRAGASGEMMTWPGQSHARARRANGTGARPVAECL